MDYIQHPRERKGFETFTAEEENAFCIMKFMLVLEPSKRATIDDVVRCEWMQRWGLPELQRMHDAIPECCILLPICMSNYVICKPFGLM